MDELTKLPGVGRKTANVVIEQRLGLPGLAVDTHVFRISARMGPSSGKNVETTEQELCALILKKMGRGASLVYLSWQTGLFCPQAGMRYLLFKRYLS